MAQQSGFFDSTYVVDEVEGFPRGNKAVDAAFMARFNRTFYTDGVIRSTNTAFQVTADGASGRALAVAAGACIIRGYYAFNDEAAALSVDFSEDDVTVIIAQRLDLTTAASAAISLVALTDAGATPTNTATVQDIWLARVVIPGGTVNIMQAMISDLRTTDACGWVIAALAKTDNDALPTYVQLGATRVATVNGGTATALTATVPDFDPAVDAKVSVRIIPANTCGNNPTLAVNGGTAYPIYDSGNTAALANDLRAGVPCDLIYYGGKYFFKSAGGNRYATGTATLTGTGGNVYQLTVTGLSFRPRIALATQNGTIAKKGMAIVGDAAGSILGRAGYQEMLANTNLTDSGFAINTGYSSGNGWVAGGTVTWYAFG